MVSKWLIPYNLLMDVSKNSGTSKSSILIGFSIINHPFWGTTIFGNFHPLINGWGILGVSPPTDPITLDPNFLPSNGTSKAARDGCRKSNRVGWKRRKNRVVGSLRCFFFWMDTESIPCTNFNKSSWWLNQPICKILVKLKIIPT